MQELPSTLSSSLYLYGRQDVAFEGLVCEYERTCLVEVFGQLIIVYFIAWFMLSERFLVFGY